MAHVRSAAAAFSRASASRAASISGRRGRSASAGSLRPRTPLRRSCPSATTLLSSAAENSPFTRNASTSSAGASAGRSTRPLTRTIAARGTRARTSRASARPPYRSPRPRHTSTRNAPNRALWLNASSAVVTVSTCHRGKRRARLRADPGSSSTMSNAPSTPFPPSRSHGFTTRGKTATVAGPVRKGCCGFRVDWKRGRVGRVTSGHLPGCPHALLVSYLGTMPGTGNTTIPTPEDPSFSSSTSSPREPRGSGALPRVERAPARAHPRGRAPRKCRGGRRSRCPFTSGQCRSWSGE